MDISSNTFTARLANLDATLEGYDRSLYDTTTYNLNPLYYHQINRTVGISSVDLNIYFDELADGSWGGISNWKQLNGQWENIPGSASTPGNPLSIAFANDWNTFTDIPYILNHINEIPVFDPIGPICQNTTAPTLPSVSTERIGADSKTASHHVSGDPNAWQTSCGAFCPDRVWL